MAITPTFKAPVKAPVMSGIPPRGATPPGPPQNYNAWVAYHRANNTYIPDNAQRTAAYHAYAAARGLPTPWVGSAGPSGTPAPANANPISAGAPPSFDAGAYLATDPTYQAGVANENQRFQGLTGIDASGNHVGSGSLEAAKAARLNDIAIARTNSLQGYQDTGRTVDQRAASRGMYHSGLRDLQNARNLAQLQQANSGYDLSQGNINTQYPADLAAAIASHNNNLLGLKGTAGAAGWDAFMRTQGL